MEVTYHLVLDIELKSLLAERGLARLNNQTKELQKNASNAFGGGAFAIRGVSSELRNLSQQLTLFVAALGAGFVYATKQIGSAAAQMESFRTSMGVLTGSATVARDLIKDLVDYAARTPLELGELIKGANELVAYGVAAKNVIPILNDLGQAVLPLKAMGVTLEQGIRAFVQANIATRTGGAGMRITTFLPFGVTPSEVKALGKQMGGDYSAAFLSILKEKFSGIFEQMQGTLVQVTSNLKDILFRALAGLGEPILPQLKELTLGLTAIINRIAEFAKLHPEALSNAFKAIGDTAKEMLGPVINILKSFGESIERNPELLATFAANLTRITIGLAEFSIALNVISKLADFLALIVLLQISLPRIGMVFTGLAAPFMAIGTKGVAVAASMTAATSATTALAGSMVAIPWAPFIAGAALVVGGLIAWNIHQKNVNAAVSAAIKPADERIKKLNDEETAIMDIVKAVGDWSAILRRTPSAEATEKHAVAFEEVKKKIIALNSQYPEYLKKLGLTIDASGELRDINGELVDKLYQLNRIFNSIDTSMFVDQLANAITQAFSLRDALEAATRSNNTFISSFGNKVRGAFGEEPITSVPVQNADGSWSTVEMKQSELDKAKKFGEWWEGYTTPEEAKTTETERQKPSGFDSKKGSGGKNKAEDIQTALEKAAELELKERQEANKSLHDWRLALELDTRYAEDSADILKITLAAYETRFDYLKNEIIAIAHVIDTMNELTPENDEAAAAIRKLVLGLQNWESDIQLETIPELKNLIDSLKKVIGANEDLAKDIEKRVDELQNPELAPSVQRWVDESTIADEIIKGMKWGLALRQFSISRPDVGRKGEYRYELSGGKPDWSLGIGYWEKLEKGSIQWVKGFERFIGKFGDLLKGFLRDYSGVLNDFLGSLEGKAWSGGKVGKQDWMGLGQNIFSQAATGGGKEGAGWGGNLADLLKIGSQWGGPLGTLISSGIGLLANNLFNTDEPLEIKMPVDVNIVGIQANAANFFSFKGFEGFSFTSRFKATFEAGIF